MSVQDRMVTFFKALGYTGAINDMYRKYLLDQTSQTSGSTDDLLRYFLRDRWGYRGSLDDMLREHLRYLGYTGSVTDMLYTAWGSAGIAGISFAADLKTTVVPNYGSGAATYTRATTATVTDHENIIRPVLSGEVRFRGARRVYNRCGFNTENFTGLSKTGGTITGGVTDPLGGSTASTFTGAGANEQFFLTTASSQSVGDTVTNSVWIKRRTGSGTIQLHQSYNGTTYQTVPVTSEWQRVSITNSAMDTANGSWAIRIVTAGDAVDVWHPQREVVTGQSIQTPAEYVSVGALSSPYHGAMVDGVKYFSTTNGNTVSSNVVTEASGSPISLATLKGYLAEGARTNLVLQSQTLGTTWTVSAASVLADQYVAPDGTTTADRITAAVSGAVGHYITQSLTQPTGPTTFSAFFKYVSNQWVALELFDGTNDKYASFDVQNGVVGAVSAGVTSTITAYPNGWYRVTATFTTLNAAGLVSIILNNSNSASAVNWVGTGAEMVAAWGAQLEAGAFASSYIPTTTASVPRNADVLTYPVSGNLSASTGSAYAEFSCYGQTVGTFSTVISGGNAADTRIIYRDVSGARTFDGTNAVSALGSQPLGSTVYKAATSWGGSGLLITQSGLATQSTSFDGAFDATSSFGVGVMANSSSAQLFGTIRNVRIWQTQFSAAQLQTITT